MTINGRLVLTFELGRHHVTGEPQWRSRDGNILYVPNDFKTIQPTEMENRWVCESTRTIYEAPNDGKFKIVVVNLIRPAVTARCLRRRATHQMAGAPA
ncbi:MAG: hypothetical protein NTW60_02620 [Candidatus Wolfebacteria bacterium]|nr:hypothetical protein [Candidatus Wolfebacteria bacterium]